MSGTLATDDIASVVLARAVSGDARALEQIIARYHDDMTRGLCAIFPAERAAAALGEPVGPASATHDSTFSNSSCHYDSAGSDASVTIWYHPGLVRTDWERQMAKIGMTPEMSVAGIGEAAYRLDPTATHPRVKLTAFGGDHDVWVIIADVADITRIASTAEREVRDLLAAVR